MEFAKSINNELRAISPPLSLSQLSSISENDWAAMQTAELDDALEIVLRLVGEAIIASAEPKSSSSTVQIAALRTTFDKMACSKILEGSNEFIIQRKKFYHYLYS